MWKTNQKTKVKMMKTNKIWKVGVSTIVGLLMAMWLVVPSAIPEPVTCGITIKGSMIRKEMINCVTEKMALYLDSQDVKITGYESKILSFAGDSSYYSPKIDFVFEEYLPRSIDFSCNLFDVMEKINCVVKPG